MTNSKIGKNCDLGTVQHLLGITYVIYFYIPMILTEKKKSPPRTAEHLQQPQDGQDGPWTQDGQGHGWTNIWMNQLGQWGLSFIIIPISFQMGASMDWFERDLKETVLFTNIWGCCTSSLHSRVVSSGTFLRHLKARWLRPIGWPGLCKRNTFGDTATKKQKNGTCLGLGHVPSKAS